MKITSFKIENGMLLVGTDDVDHQQFTYEAERFATVKELEEEISRRVALDDAVKVKKDFKIATLSAELELKVADNIKEVP